MIHDGSIGDANAIKLPKTLRSPFLRMWLAGGPPGFEHAATQVVCTVAQQRNNYALDPFKVAVVVGVKLLQLKQTVLACLPHAVQHILLTIVSMPHDTVSD